MVAHRLPWSSVPLVPTIAVAQPPAVKRAAQSIVIGNRTELPKWKQESYDAVAGR